jgi:Icc-related predicted phosphoesterase
MKILAVSDNVLGQMENAINLHRVYGECELVISCGDMPAHYLEYITTVLSLPLFFVQGNHDTNYAEGRPGGDDLHRQLRIFRGISFAGLEGCIRYNYEPLQYSEAEMFRMVLGLAPAILYYKMRQNRRLDVMVTHSPPRHVHDQEDRTHRGFRSFNWLINVYQPRYLIHGHVDVLDRRKQTVTQVHKTTVININPVKVLTIERSS